MSSSSSVSTPSRATTAGRYLLGLGPELLSGLGQGDGQDAFVGGVAAACDQAGGLQPLEQRREGARIEREGGAEVTDRTRTPLPQREHHQILRVVSPPVSAAGRPRARRGS